MARLPACPIPSAQALVITGSLKTTYEGAWAPLTWWQPTQVNARLEACEEVHYYATCSRAKSGDSSPPKKTMALMTVAVIAPLGALPSPPLESKQGRQAP